MDRLRYTYLMIFCLTLVSINGKDEDISSCQIGVMVKRGTTWKTAPQRSLSIKCPVKHCGESLNIYWCKLLFINHCEQINETENVKITQDHIEDELISNLTFKHISINDDGLYRCVIKEYKENQISHTINISVSDLNQEVENSDNNEVQPLSYPEGNWPWLPYFCICLSIALLATALTVLTHLSFLGFKRTLNYTPTNGQEMSTCMIPDLPKRSDPITPVLQTRISVLNDIYCPITAGTSQSPSFLITSGNQPLANIANESQDYAVYAVINHAKSMLPVRKEHTVAKNPEYATISIS